MTRDQIVERVKAVHPDMTEEQIDTSLEKLLHLGLIERRRELPRNMPLTVEAEAALVEEIGSRYPEQVIQAMVDRLVEAGVFVRVS